MKHITPHWISAVRMGRKFHWGNGIKGVCWGRAWCSLGWKNFPNIKPFSSMECSSGGIWRWSLRYIKKRIFNEIFTQGYNYQWVVRGKEVPPALFWKLKTSALTLKKICPDCVQLWLKFLLENALLRFSNILGSLSLMCCGWNVYRNVLIPRNHRCPENFLVVPLSHIMRVLFQCISRKMGSMLLRKGLRTTCLESRDELKVVFKKNSYLSNFTNFCIKSIVQSVPKRDISITLLFIGSTSFHSGGRFQKLLKKNWTHTT